MDGIHRHHYIDTMGQQHFLTRETARHTVETRVGKVIVRRYNGTLVKPDIAARIEEGENPAEMNIPMGQGNTYSVQVPLIQKYEDELAAYDDPNVERFKALTGGRSYIQDDSAGVRMIRAHARGGKTYAIESILIPARINVWPSPAEADYRKYNTQDEYLASACRQCEQLGGVIERGSRN